MIITQLKINHRNLIYSLKSSLLGVIFLLGVFLLSSCSDQGCIDADDFGEFESQTIEVSANPSQDNCVYDASKELLDQPDGIKTCLTANAKTTQDENGVSLTSPVPPGGCGGYADSHYRHLCIDDCVQQCFQAKAASAGVIEPYWTSTDAKVSGKNVGVTIRPGSKVMVRTIGSVKLGDKINYPDIYIPADEPRPISKTINWTDSFFDVRAGQNLDIRFSGKWTDGADTIGLSATPYNLSRRVVAYVIPHPDGYGFNTSALTERAGARVVPLLPDPDALKCAYSASGDSKESNCYHDASAYTGLNYTGGINSSLTIAAFPISSAFKTTGLGTYGGMIRWTNDGLESSDNFNPFGSASCANSGTGDCTGVSGITNGVMLDAISSSGYVNNSINSYSVSFKSLTTDASCNTNLTVSIQGKATPSATAFTTITSGTFTVGVSNSTWSTAKIPLDSQQKLVVTIPTNPTYAGGVNCSKAIAIKFNKYQDIVINRSGFVSFSSLKGSGNCLLEGRIVNPSGSHFSSSYTETVSSVSTTVNLTPDFYEYDSFSTPTASLDPLSNLSVPATPAIGPSSWSTRSVFVRKGQIIRFSPESWNGTWTAGSVVRQCGIGMAMRIDPRPAVLCRGTRSEQVENPSCVPQYETDGRLIGCQPLARECSDSKDTTYFCPSDNCTSSFTCTTAANSNTKTCSALGAVKNTPTTCSLPATGIPNATTCLACSTKLLANATQSPRKAVDGLNICYDLESYTGKVSNIPTVGFASDDNGQITSTNTKNAKILSSFNGEYGNLIGFNNSDGAVETTTPNNRIFKLNSPLTFSSSGRLRFFIIDASSDFTNLNSFKDIPSGYTDNSVRGTAYSGSNGVKIQTSGMLDFNNGQFLQAKLCKEDSNTSTLCKLSNPAQLSGQPGILELDPTTTASTPVATTASLYKFDAYGNLVRGEKTLIDSECTTAQGVEAATNSDFYCHTYGLVTDTDQVANLRLTFKIYDPEVMDCKLTTTAAANNGITIKNPMYNTGLNSNPLAGQMCDSTELPVAAIPEGITGKTLCTKEFYCSNKYANNTGKYFVNIKVKSPVSGRISSIIGEVITPIIEVMDGTKDGTKVGQAERIYKLLIADSRYKAILTMCLIMMYTFYGLGFLMGVSQLNHSELINRVIKIGLIYLFVGESGWYWFDKIVVKFFKNGTDYLSFVMASSFDDSTALATAINTGDFYDKSILFSSVDKVFGMFFSSVVQKKISALLFASIFGWAYLLIIYNSFLLYVYAVANAVLLYLTAQVFISILFTLGPIFFVFTLFAQTKTMFDNWLKQLIGFSLQQIFLLTTLAFFNMMMYEVLKMSLGFKICWAEVWVIHIVIRVSLMSFWTIASLPPRTNAQSETGNIGNPEGIPSLFSILFIWVIASLMLKFVTFMTDLAASIGGGITASSLGAGIKSMASDIKGGINKAKSYAWESTGGKATRALDKGLFDSGKSAEEDRQKRRKQNAADLGAKGAMSEAGEKAMNKYKKNNADELIGMSKEQRETKLKEVRDTAMMKKATDLGKSPEEAKRIMNAKFDNTSTTLTGAMANFAKESYKTGGNANSSLADKSVDTKISQKQVKKFMERSSEEKREKMMKGIEDGEIKVGKGRMGRIGGAINKKFKEVGKAFNDGDKNEASKRLEQSGEINVNALGNNKAGYLARSKEDQGKIDKLAKEIKAERKADTKAINPNTSGAIAAARQAKSIADKLESGASTDQTRKAGTLSSKILGREKGISNMVSNFKERRAESKKASSQAKEKAREKVGADASNARDEAQTFRNVANRAETAATDLKAKPEFQAMESQIGSLKEQHQKQTASGDKDGAKETLAKLNEATSNPKYQKQKGKIAKAESAAKQASQKAEEADARADSAEDLKGDMDAAEDMNQNIEEALKQNPQNKAAKAAKKAFESIRSRKDYQDFRANHTAFECKDSAEDEDSDSTISEAEGEAKEDAEDAMSGDESTPPPSSASGSTASGSRAAAAPTRTASSGGSVTANPASPTPVTVATPAPTADTAVADTMVEYVTVEDGLEDEIGGAVIEDDLAIEDLDVPAPIQAPTNPRDEETI